MEGLKQAQQTYDNQLPPDTTERDELIDSLAELIVLSGVVVLPTTLDSIYREHLNIWMDGNSWKSISTLNKINQFKELQLELCKSMIADILNKGE